MFKLKDDSFNKKQKEMLRKDISDDVIGNLKMELLMIQPYYNDVRNSFEYEDLGGPISTIFSQDWAAAIINQGRLPGKYAPRQVILEWVQKYKNPSGTPREQYGDMLRINEMIYRDGIKPTWYIDNVLFEMEQDHE